MKQNLIRKCYVCGTIELDGKLVSKGEYNENDFKYTHTILSKECFDNMYGEDDINGFNIRKKASYASCKPLNTHQNP